MPDPSTPHGAQAARPRIWPAVLIVLAHLVIRLGTFLHASTNIEYLVGYLVAPALAALLLIIWWLAVSRVPWRERLAGLAFFIAALAWIALNQSENGELLLMVALPAMTTGVVVILLVTSRLGAGRRRWAATAMIVSCAVFFTALRADSLGGNMQPVLSWRWNPTSEDLLAAPQPSASSGTALLPTTASPGDWPGFRGAERDGRVIGAAFPVNWSEQPPRELWRRPAGLGWSSFAVVGDYLFTQEQRGRDELVVCYRADTGEEVWTKGVPERFEDSMGSGPRATPTFHEGKLYALGATGVLRCMEASTGSTVWQRDLVEDTGAGAPQWGFSSSPLIVAERVVVFSGANKGNSVVAYSCASGDLAWTAGAGSHGYSSAHVAHFAGVPQILMVSNFGLQSFAPENGEGLWEHPWDIKGNPRIVQPLMPDHDSVMIATSSGKGTRLLGISKEDGSWKVEDRWTARRFRPYFNDFVYHNGYCYGFDGNRFCCIDAATGELAWKGERCGGQVLLIADLAMLLVLSEAGEAILLQATPEALTEVGRFQALSGKTWNHPVVAHGKLFVRNSEEAACFALPKREAS